MIGSFDNSGSPTIAIKVSGPLGSERDFTALIDTGFTGFLSIPLLDAFPVGLILHGTMAVTLADGSTQYKLTCLGMAHLGTEKEVGLILIEPQSTQVLAGMEFLRKFKKRLVVDPTTGSVELQP